MLCLHALSSVALALAFFAASDQALRIWSRELWNTAFWASGTLEATHASYFFRKSSQAAIPVVWALSAVLRVISANAAVAMGVTRSVRLSYLPE